MRICSGCNKELNIEEQRAAHIEAYETDKGFMSENVQCKDCWARYQQIAGTFLWNRMKRDAEDVANE